MDHRPASDGSRNIRLTGFSRLDGAVHLLAGLGRGTDVRGFVMADVEADLGLRLPGVRLVSIDCPAAPVIEREAARVPNSTRPVVRRMTVTFALRLGLEGAEARPVAVRLVYVADGLETGRPELRRSFALGGPVGGV